MTDLVFHHCQDGLPVPLDGRIPVLIYGRRPPREGAACIGGPVLPAVRRLEVPVHHRAFDLLTMAMAVTAADTFVDRRAAADGWARELRLQIAVVDPDPWQPLLGTLETALRFLSGDQWSLDVVGGGLVFAGWAYPGRLTRLAGRDCTSLFSAGLDSTIGVLDLMAAGGRPVLISHSYRGDADRQHTVMARLPVSVSRFAAIAHPLSRLGDPNDVQMRTRSFNFLAYGALVAATMAERGFAEGPVNLHVPENGLIALNPPLTPRRIGSLSTRTTHPHFLDLVQRVMDGLDIPVRISRRPYNIMTKGEMMAACADPATLATVAELTVSCGKWKRTGLQCGRCVPCLIRRASFNHAEIPDGTDYASEGRDLQAVLKNEHIRDDVLAMILAARQLPDRNMRRWVAQSGPLPADGRERDGLVDVARRGMAEVSQYLDRVGLLH